MSNIPLKLMHCATCHETNLVNRPELVEQIPEITKAMRDHCELILDAVDDQDVAAVSISTKRAELRIRLLRTARLIKQWADRLEGK